MGKAWRETTWGNEVTLNYGKAIRGYQDATGPYQVFGSNGSVGWHTEKLADGPGVILGRKGAYRGVRYSPDPFFVIDTAYYLTPKSEMNMRWLYYAVVFHRLGEIDDGSPIPSTTRAAVYVRPFRAPARHEQDLIAEVLGSLDDKIELNRRMNVTLEEMAQALFRDWFVDFGPTRRKLDGATDPITIIGGLVQDIERAQGLADLFPATLGDDGLPEGWVKKAFSTLVDIIGGGTPKTSIERYWSGSIPWFSVKDTPTKGSVFVDVTEKTISMEGLENSAARLVRAGTTIISARGTVGNLALAAHEMTFNQSCYGLQGNGAIGDFFVFLTAQNVVERLKGMAHGSVFSTITRATFDGVDIVSSGNAILSAFEEIVGLLFEKINSNIKENRTLAHTRDLLLPKLMSGEFRMGISTRAD